MIFLLLSLLSTAAEAAAARKVDAGIVEFKQQATPSNPAAGFNRIYSKVDGLPYWLNSAGVEQGIALGTPSPLTTKGDLYTFSTVGARLPVGTDGFLLTADSAEVTGLKWAAAPTSGINQLTGDVTAGPGSGSQTATIANLAVTNAKIANSTIDLTTKVTGTLPVANGGTGASTLTADNVILGNGTSAVQFVAPGTSGNVLTSNGTTWTSAAAAGASSNIQKSIAQTGHGFSVGQALYYNGTSYVLADSDADSTSEVAGLVLSVTDANNFVLAMAGEITGLSGLTSGSTYFLSGTAGALTATEPTSTNTVSKPVLIATSTTAGYIIQSRGIVNSSSGSGGIPTYSAVIAGASETTDCNSGTCTIYLEGSVDWISSATRASAGNYTVNFQAGIFTTGAICQITVTNGIRITRAIRGGTSSTNFITYTDAGSPNDSAFNIFCKDAS